MLETVEKVMRICREMQEEQEVKFVDEDVKDDEDVYRFETNFGVHRELWTD